MRAVQYPLDILPDASVLPQDYIVSECNHLLTHTLTHASLLDTPVLLVLGAKGSGKTHLLHWLMAQRQIQKIDVGALGAYPAERWMKSGICYAIDDAQAVAPEAALAQAINHARASRAGLLLMMDAAFVPQTPDLASRLQAAHRLIIPPPDDALRSALFIKRFADLQWRCDADVMAYVLPRLPRDITSLQAFITRADREGLAQKRALTIPFAAHILAMMDTD